MMPANARFRRVAIPSVPSNSQICRKRPFNQIHPAVKLGIISAGVVYSYAREARAMRVI